ncbi:MAG: DUF1799 domain-containing protein [Solimonas sp.]
MTVEEASDPPVEVWPDNAAAVSVFVALATQWRHAGMAGAATGLDYNVLFKKLDRMGLAPDQYDQIESDIRVLEDAALEKMREESKN